MREFTLISIIILVLLVSSCVKPIWPSAEFAKKYKYYEVPIETLTKEDSLDRYPMFPYGKLGINQHLNNYYSFRCIGRIYLTYVVNENGYTEDIKIIDADVPGEYNVLKTAFEDMPRWIPAMKDSVYVKSSMFHTINCW